MTMTMAMVIDTARPPLTLNTHHIRTTNPTHNPPSSTHDPHNMNNITPTDNTLPSFFQGAHKGTTAGLTLDEATAEYSRGGFTRAWRRLTTHSTLETASYLAVTPTANCLQLSAHYHLPLSHGRGPCPELSRRVGTNWV
jgi:hypothetical protein